MKLSMWIIADKLSEYTPTVSIVSGKMNITGVRQLLSADKVRSDILYVSLVEGEDTGSENASVLCTNGADWIRLQTDDVDEVINTILDVFEAFQKWEAELKEAVAQAQNIQYMLDISAYALPFPTVISNAFGNVVGYSKGYEQYAETDPYWASIIHKQKMDDMVFAENVYDARMNSIKDWDTTARIFQTMQNPIIGMHLTINEEIVGSIVIIEAGGVLTIGVCQVAELLRDSLSKALNVRGKDAELRTVMAIAEEYLDGKNVDTGRLWDTIVKYTGREDEDMELILMKNLLRSDFSYKNNLAYRMTSQENRTFGLVFHEYVGVILCSDREREFLNQFQNKLQRTEFIMGVSLLFSDVHAMQKAGNQAALALMSGSQDAGSVNHCVDHAYTYFLNKLAGDKSFGTELIHPGVLQLKKYDEKHNTNFYETLYQYLLQERNVVATAKSLFIHRNSMIYRLQRIEKLLNVNLDDPNMRIYLLLSFQIDQIMQNQKIAELFQNQDFPGSLEGKQLFWADVREQVFGDKPEKPQEISSETETES